MKYLMLKLRTDKLEKVENTGSEVRNEILALLTLGKWFNFLKHQFIHSCLLRICVRFEFYWNATFLCFNKQTSLFQDPFPLN